MPAQLDPFDPANCVSFRLRRAARQVAKFYDAALKPVDLRNTQFTLLAVLVSGGAQNIGQLSQAMATDGTTLTRNLEVLVRRGLVENTTHDEDERIRLVKASVSGGQLYAKGLPLWRSAQQRMLDVLGEGPWNDMTLLLQEVETVG
jgi:DNA-binding MarR family transcriptional regulator